MGKLDGVELRNDVPFEESHGSRFYRSLITVMIALIVGFVFSYLFNEKIGAFLFVQALFSGMVSFVKPENPEKKPYIIGDSNEIVYLTKKELEKRLKKGKKSFHDL